LKRSHGLEKYAGPGQWNDPDMLLVGNYGKGHATSANGRFKGLTDTEYFSHMAIWAMMASPLLSSCDLRSMNEATKAILMNETLLRINQDKLGKQASRVSKKDNVWTYKKDLHHGGVALAFLNTSNSTKQVNIDWKNYTDMSNFKIISATEGQLTVTENRTVNLAPHQTLVFELSATK
jgi:alpha-galactosidase